ncbi:MAG TPA: hypothetical protein VKD66_15045, partial [Streptosporangiaceae bacterium]|nr:hypothetical protein [Streptosporangiaceae bacterium]
ELKGRDYVNACRWSPDGRRVLYLPHTWPIDFSNQRDTLTVCDADGGRRREVITVEHGKHTLYVDWR